jgi:hypothetical protein
MLDEIEIKNVFRANLENSGIVPKTSIAWPNVKFTPANSPIWVEFAYIPATEVFSSNSTDVLTAIMQHTINVPTDTGTDYATGIGKQIGDLYESAEVIYTDDYGISIDSVQAQPAGKISDLWWSYIVDVNIKVYRK